jgi:hypothetical protein
MKRGATKAEMEVGGKWRLLEMEAVKRRRRGLDCCEEKKVEEMEAEKRGRLVKWRLKREEGRGNES